MTFDRSYSTIQILRVSHPFCSTNAKTEEDEDSQPCSQHRDETRELLVEYCTAH